jgi:transcriptional regulator with XRE-family HTH domain
MNDQSRGQKIRAARLNKRLTELQCAKQAGCPHAVWLGLEQDEKLDVEPDLRAFLDRFTDGEVSIASW